MLCQTLRLEREKESMNQAYYVKLDTFEGPLDLLLHLINRYEIDIYDIPMAQITEQYMEYIQTMQQLELNIASEYLVMAATLVAIKSQMLLPTEELPGEADDDYMEDPREELMERLIEYKKYKSAAKQLGEKELDANQIFTRAPLHIGEEQLSKAPVEKGEVSIYDMLDALGKLFERKKWNAPLETKIQRIEIPVEQRMEEIMHVVKRAKNGIAFEELFPVPSRSLIVVSFIAILELMKENRIVCKQKRHFDSLYLYDYEPPITVVTNRERTYE